MKFIAEPIKESINFYQTLEYDSLISSYQASWTSVIDHKFSGNNKYIVKLNNDYYDPNSIYAKNGKTHINFKNIELTKYVYRIPEVTIEIIN